MFGAAAGAGRSDPLTDHMGFAIPYTFAGAGHNFYPDFLVRLANGATLGLEVKGYEDEQDRAKYAAAQR